MIVVEGINDARNVRQYLDVDIYVLGSATKTGTSATREELRRLQSRYRRIVLLLDPDVAGRQARNDIDRLLDGNKVRYWTTRSLYSRPAGWLAGCHPPHTARRWISNGADIVLHHCDTDAVLARVHSDDPGDTG